MWRAGCKLQAAGCGLQAAGCRLQAADLQGAQRAEDLKHHVCRRLLRGRVRVRVRVGVGVGARVRVRVSCLQAPGEG